MPPAELYRFLNRAQDFLRGMQLLREDEAYQSSSALLGIHSAVSYTDALRTGLGEESLAADDHRVAVNALQRLLARRNVEDRTGLSHLEALISQKSAVAYGRRRLSTDEFQLIFTRAERFAKWGNGLGDRLQIGGWKYGNQ